MLLRLGAFGAAALVCLSGWALDVNQATEAQLDGIKGLGPSSTARILKAREQGPFKDWPDLMTRVQGIRSKTAANLSAAGLTVNDQPYPRPAP